MTNPWLEHVKKYWARHSNLSYKQALIGAKKSYKAGSKTVKKNKEKGA